MNRYFFLQNGELLFRLREPRSEDAAFLEIYFTVQFSGFFVICLFLDFSRKIQSFQILETLFIFCIFPKKFRVCSFQLLENLFTFCVFPENSEFTVFDARKKARDHLLQNC